MTLFSESRHQKNRGPLIAVIKIELDQQNTDRIFLHLKDNDQELAEQFIVKHNLNRMLKKHIYQKIKISREAVIKDQHQSPILNQNKKQDQNQQKRQENNSNYYRKQEKIENQYKRSSQDNHYENNFNEENDLFGTPIKTKNSNQFDESQNKMNFRKNNQKQLPLEKMSLQKNDPYIKCNKIQEKNNDPIHNFKNKNQLQECFSTNQPQKFLSEEDLQFQSDFNITPVTNEEVKNRQKNIYDVTGLKLKSTLNQTNQNDQKNQQNLNKKHKQTNFFKSQSQSEKGHFKIQMHNKNNPQFQDYYQYNTKNQLLNKQNENTQKDKPKTVDHFIQLSQKKYSYLLPQKTYHLPQKYPLLQQKKYFDLPQKADKFIGQDHANTHKLQQIIQKYQQQTKFSSIDKEETPEYTEDNYVSFNVPCSQTPQEIFHHQSSNHYHDPEFSIKYEHKNSPQNSQKKIGSIRSNTIPLGDSSHRQNVSSGENNLFNQKNSIRNYNQDSDLFDQSQNFKNLTIKGQQNVEINSQYIDGNSQYDEQSWRPSRVKFYGKQEIKSLRQSTMSKSLSRTEVSRINKAVTSRLYNEQEIKKKYLNQLKARAINLKQEENQQEEELTHKPEINALSKILAQNRNKQHKTLQDYLIQQGKMIQQKRQNQIDHQAKKILQNCPFKPQISQNSQKITSLQRSRSKSRVSSNHTDLNRCSSSKKIHPQKPSFHPQINKLSQQIVKQKGNFMERQKTFQEEKNSKLFKKQQEQKLTQKIDSKNGQKLFHPQLTQRSIKLAQHHNQQNREKYNKSVHSYLYELSKVPKHQQKLNQKPSINPESLKLIHQLHEKRINWLFLELDNDEDGIISNCKISIDNIPTQMLQIMAPVLYEMEDLETELNLQDFRNAMKNLTKGLDPWQKSILYGYGNSVRV